MDPNMEDYKHCSMVYRNLGQPHLQEVGLTQILTYHINDTTFGWESKALAITRSQPLACVWRGPKLSYLTPKLASKTLVSF